jgi:flagellar FliL protein
VKGKLKFVVPIVLLLVLGVGYKTVLAKPAEKAPKPKVHGAVYVLPKEFVLNTADGRYAKLWLALVLPHEEAAHLAEAGHGPKPPEGFGPLPQEAIVRSLVGDVVGDADGDELTKTEGREKLQAKLLKALKKRTDVHAEEVLFTDVAVQ